METYFVGYTYTHPMVRIVIERILSLFSVRERENIEGKGAHVLRGLAFGVIGNEIRISHVVSVSFPLFCLGRVSNNTRISFILSPSLCPLLLIGI